MKQQNFSDGQDRTSYSLLRRIRNIFTKNIIIKLACIVFALLLWGYVLSVQKPMRSITVSNVPLSFEGEADLLAKGLCVRGDRTEILKNISAVIRCQITNASYITPRTVSATLNLRNISQAKEYTIPVSLSVSSALGVVQSANPSGIEVEIDTLMTRSIPVTVNYVGELPEGYWADMNNATSAPRIEIQGPRTDISRVVSAVCEISLEGQTSTIYRTFDVTLFDSDGQEVDRDILVGMIPTCTMRIPIYAAKTVPVDALGSLIGTDNLAANHVLYSAVATPAEVRIVGSKAAVEAVSEITLEPVNVSGLSEAQAFTANPVLPDGIRIPDLTEILLNVDIRESVISQDFAQVPIILEGLPKGYTAALDIDSADLYIEGRYSLASIIKRSDVKLIVDVTGFESGEHELPILPFIKDDETTIELTTKVSADTVKVTITAPEQTN